MTTPEQPGFFFWEPGQPAREGRPRIFQSPQDLWASAVDYFNWTMANPLYEERAASDDGSPTTIEIRKVRAMTIGGLCVFLGIDPITWKNYREREEYFRVISAVEQVMRTQKFEAAAAGLLNANLISRDLGMADKHQFGGDPDNPTPVALGPIQLVPVEPKPHGSESSKPTD